ncbi:MAG TPA: SRPBCC domain-containing protein [Dehalococcoidia bacterium]|nr:SRPBCC domain-containing protein [Dehalococcoidia bacterium]
MAAVAVERSIEIAASVDVVWELLSTQEGLRQWLTPNIEIDVRLGGAYRLVEPEANQMISGRVLELVPKQRLTLSWFEEGGDWRQPTRKSFVLTPIPGGTRVDARQDGFEGIGKPGWPATYEAYERGWDRHAILAALKRCAEAAVPARTAGH